MLRIAPSDVSACDCAGHGVDPPRQPRPHHRSPRTHRHRYFGVLAPNSPHRAAVTEMAQSTAVQTAQPLEVRSEPANTGAGEGALGVSNPLPTLAEPAQPVEPKRPAHSLGGADGPHLRGVPAAVPSVWRADAHHRLHHAQRRHPLHTGAYYWCI